MEEKEENQIRLNPMMPRRYSSNKRAEIRKKEKEVLTGKKDDNIIYPYPVGTYLCKEEYGIKHIDKVEEYVLNGVKNYVILVLDVLKEPRLSTPIDIDSLLKEWSKVDSNDINLDKQDGVIFGSTEKEFDKLHDEKHGFNVKQPKDNIQKVSDDFCEFMISASKGYAETLAKQREEEKPKVMEKTSNQ